MARKTKKKKVTKQIIVFVGVVVKDNKVLMTIRYEPECKDAHMKWELPGGKANLKELPEKAVAREILEETGVQVKVTAMLPYIHTHIWHYDWGIQKTFLVGYVCTFVKQHAIPKDHHVYGFDWINVVDVDKLETLPGSKEFVELYGTI